MTISGFSVRRPVFTSMMMLIILVFGAVSLLHLPIDLMPEMEYPTLTVVTNYENASPEEMEELITRRVEEAVAAIPGVEEVTSVSAEGASQVRITFTWGTNLDVASNDVRDRLDRIMHRLPDDADRPQLRKFDPSSFPILILGASSRLNPIDLRELIDEVIKQRMEQIPGVAVVDVWGGLEREVQVNLDPDRVVALGLPLDSLLQTIRDANVIVPAGSIERDHLDVTLRTPGQFADLDELRNTVVAYRGDSPIYLGQIADIEDTHQRPTRIVRINGVPGVRLAVRKQSGTNTVDVARRALDEMERINLDIPQVNLVPIIDTSTYIQRSINNVSGSVVLGGTLAVFILLFFLRNFRSTLIIGLSIPICIVATFAMIYFGGLTLNMMTIGGLALGVGMMVDNAIVVLESIVRRREGGLPGIEAAEKGANDVSAAVVAGTVTTLVIFFPLVFIKGMASVMFTQLGYVISFSLICSLFVALTLVPMMSAYLLRPPGEHGPLLVRRAAAAAGWGLNLLEQSYEQVLQSVMRFRGTVLLTAALLLVGSLWLGTQVGAEFMPNTDEGEVRVNIEMDVGTRLEVLDRQMQQVEAIVLAHVPEVENWVTSVGSSGWRASGGATGDIRMSLVPSRQRTRTSEQIADTLRPLLSEIAGTTVRTRAGQGLFLLRMGASDGARLQIEIRGHDLGTLDALAHRVREITQQIPGVTDVQVSREAGAPQELVRIDRARAADLGLSVGQIARALQTAVAGSQAGEYREAGTEYRILVRLRDAERLDLDDLLNFTVTNNRGETIALRNVVEFVPSRGPVQIDRKNQQRIATVAANITGRDMGSIVTDLRAGLTEIVTPRGYEIYIAGDYEEQQEAFFELLISLLLAIMLVYMVMACLYESLRDPLVVMFSVPLAGIGVVLILLLTQTPFSVPAYIGVIMLGGIVINNAILIVDQATRLRRDEGYPTSEAVVLAGRRRLRPILMTSLSTVLGLVPLALGIGEGAEAQAPMALAVIGGLLSSTLITLVVIPIVYSLFHRERVASA